MMLNKSGERGHPCFVLHLRGKVLSFTLKYDSSCRLYTVALYQFKKVPFPTYIAESFYHDWILNFIQSLASVDMIVCFFLRLYGALH